MTSQAMNHATDTAGWLGVAPWQLPDLRDVLDDQPSYSTQLLDYLLRAKPGDSSRGGGRQWLWPDGRYRRNQPRF